MLEAAHRRTCVLWKEALARRNTKNRMSWEKFMAQVEQLFALPRPRIVHEY
jgi:hypothetical protein